MKFTAHRISAALVALSVAGPASAADVADESQHYLGVMGTYAFADDGRGWRLDELGLEPSLDESAGFSVLYGVQQPSHWGWEVQLFSEVFETDIGGVTDFYRTGATADLVYSLGDRTGFTPFLLLGIGGAYNDVSPEEDKFDFIANAGIGFVTAPLFERGEIRIRGEARYIYDNFEDGYGDVRLGLGIEIPLYGRPEAAPLPPAEPARVVEVEKVVEVSTGVTDSDGDGVVDESDKCPNTPAGERVDGSGCPLGKVMALNGVTFEFNKTRLRPDAETILDLAADVLKKYPDMQVEVAGHTDNVGSDAYNQKLSEGRAAAVLDYFKQKGVTNPLSSRGYGESEPVSGNDTEEGRERNRRVELRILN